MHTAESRIQTAHASKYIAQLCKHFHHKVPVEYDEISGRVDFQPGLCMLQVADGALVIRCEAEDEAGLGRLKFILEDHLQRFAWREKPLIEWKSLA